MLKRRRLLRRSPATTRGNNYGMVNDENLDTQRAVRWELEAAALLQHLEASGIPVFQNLHAEYLEKKEASKQFQQPIDPRTPDHAAAGERTPIDGFYLGKSQTCPIRRQLHGG